MIETLICSRCKEHKPPEQFQKNSNRKTGRRSACKFCLSAAVRRSANLAGDTESGDFKNFVGSGHMLRGQTVQLDSNNNVKQRWLKTGLDPGAKLDLMFDALEALDTPFKSRAKASAPPKTNNADRMDILVMGDPHLGLHVWGKEAGGDFNLDIATSNLMGAIDDLATNTSGADTAMLVNVGDFFHADNKKSTTTAGTLVDTDTRIRKVCEDGIRLMHWACERLLKNYKKVIVKSTPGNHDWLTGSLMAVHLAIFYENHPRIEVDASPSKFLWYEFGCNLIGVTHGDGMKVLDFPGVMSTDQAQAWGRTTERLWITGHIHHLTVKEVHGCTVESFRTLAAGDAWHHGSGYRAGRDMQTITIDRYEGEVARRKVGLKKQF